MRNLRRLIGTMMLVALATGGAASAPAPVSPATAASKPASDPNTVIIDNFTFNPPTLTVTAGTTVTWVNKDDVPHTVTSTTQPRTLNSGVMDTDKTYQMTFKTPGTYPYYCTVHSHMTGTIVVK